MKTIALLILSIFCYSYNVAQSTSFHVDSLKVFPASPNIDDSITFIAYTRHTTTGTGFYDRVVIEIDSVISIFSCYTNGSFPAVHNVNDTIPIGKLQVGDYTIRFILRFLLPWELDSVEPCLTNPYYDSSFLNITVSNINNVELYGSKQLLLHPNPATHQLTLTIPPPSQATTATITDINGRQLRKEQLLNATNTLNIAELPAGLYFITVQSAEQRWVRRFVKQ